MLRRVSTMLLALAIIVGLTGQSVRADWFFSTKGKRGSGKFVSQERKVAAFDRIETSGSFDIEVLVGSDQSVTIEFDDNLIDNVITEVRSKTLTISSERSFRSRGDCRITITVPELRSIESRGSGDITVSRLKGTEFKFSLSGSGDLKVEGTVDLFDMVIRGSGDVDARRLRAKETIVTIKGSGDARVFASESIDASVYGSGDIVYYGNPEHSSKEIRGSGSIKRR